MKYGQKKRSVPLILFSILMIVTALLCVTAFGLWLYGRQNLAPTVVAPQLPPAPMQTASDDQAEPQEQTPVMETPDQYTVIYNGKQFTYNEDMVNIVLMGIDADNKPSAPLPYGSDIQADVILLAALDLKNNDMTLISINRDTMANIEIRDASGASLGVARSQLALSYAYGDGLEESCRMTCEAVSNLFYGLQIHGYGTYYMGGVSDLNDALGGVTVTILEDYPFTEMGGIYSAMTPGTTMTLNGQQAVKYIRCRLYDETGNALRMVRQKQYMLSMLSQALSQVKQNPRLVFTLFHALEAHLLTDLDIFEISYLVTQASNMQFSGEVLNLKGELTYGAESHMELVLDELALYETILNVFYEEVAP